MANAIDKIISSPHVNLEAVNPGFLHARGKLSFSERPLVMGILNVTPDSFCDGGKYFDLNKAIARAQEMIEEGADIIDIGGESTRPGAKEVTLEEELKRTIPIVKYLSGKSSIPISIDTSKSKVAQEALDAGAAIINDITALKGDLKMAHIAAKNHAGVILMHMQGSPRTMQENPHYDDVINEVRSILLKAAKSAEDLGIKKESIVIDPGIGFGKTVSHNLLLLKRLNEIVSIGYPVLVGHSRKSFIGKVLGVEAEDRLAGTLACVASSFTAGVKILRVHDVKPTIETLNMLKAIKES